jgi:hypothetical protein
VANLADLMGTAFGIALSKLSLPIVPTFMALSAGYLIASRKEVDSVEMPYLNRARLAYAARTFLETGLVPGIEEANAREPLLPWGSYGQSRTFLGSSIHDAFDSPADLERALTQHRFTDSFYLTYKQSTGHVHVLFREGVKKDDFLRAAFLSHVLVHKLDREDRDRALVRLRAGFLPNGQVVLRLPSFVQEQLLRVMGAGFASASPPGPGVAAAAEAAAAAKGGKGGKGGKGKGGNGQQQVGGWAPSGSTPALAGSTREAVPEALQYSQAQGEALYRDFLAQCKAKGWNIQGTLLNPKDNRIRNINI